MNYENDAQCYPLFRFINNLATLKCIPNLIWPQTEEVTQIHTNPLLTVENL